MQRSIWKSNVPIVDVFLKTVREVNPMKNVQIVLWNNVVAKKDDPKNFVNYSVFNELRNLYTDYEAGFNMIKNTRVSEISTKYYIMTVKSQQN